MGTHMKTTIEITDDLLTRAKRIAQRDGTTLRELVEDGLRRTLQDREQPVKRELKPLPTMGGGWLLPPYDKLGLTQAIYDDYEDRELKTLGLKPYE
jgi:hypothetical protein